MSIIKDSALAVHHSRDVAEIQRADERARHHDGGEFDEYPGPGSNWDAPRYEPSPEADAQEAGYQRGYALDYAAQPPADLPMDHQLLWVAGKLEGFSRRIKDDADDRAFRDEMNEWTAAQDDRHTDEAVRAIGVIATREGGPR